jgi:hypothetical protein
MWSRVCLVSSLLAAFAALHSTPSYAADEESAKPQEPAPKRAFGDAGQFALSLNQGFVVNATDILDGSGLQASVFILPHLSAGLAVSAQWISNSAVGPNESSTDFVLHLGPRVGYDIAFSELVSFWPQIGLDYRTLQETTTTSTPAPPGVTPQPTTSSSSNSSAFGLTVVAPILIHPAKGFFIGAGPAFYTEFSNSSNNSSGNASTSTSASTDNPKVTSLGLMAMIGGAI